MLYKNYYDYRYREGVARHLEKIIANAIQAFSFVSLFVCLFFRSSLFFSRGDVATAGEGRYLRSLNMELMPRPLEHGASVHPKDRNINTAIYVTACVAR